MGERICIQKLKTCNFILAGWPWASCFTFLSLSKIEITITLFCLPHLVAEEAVKLQCVKNAQWDAADTPGIKQRWWLSAQGDRKSTKSPAWPSPYTCLRHILSLSCVFWEKQIKCVCSFWSQTLWFWVLDLPLTSCVSSVNSTHSTSLRLTFLILNGYNNSTYPRASLVV